MQVEGFGGDFRGTLLPIDGLPDRNSVVLPDADGHVWLVDGPGRLVRVGLDGTRTVYPHPCRDKYDDPITFTDGVRLDDGRFLVAHYDQATILRIDGDQLLAEERWGPGARSRAPCRRRLPRAAG